jgi:hypothetical protein
MSVKDLLVALLECKGSILTVACLFALAHLVEAGPPIVTDDPEPTRAGGWEINVPFIIEHTCCQNTHYLAAETPRCVVASTRA